MARPTTESVPGLVGSSQSAPAVMAGSGSRARSALWTSAWAPAESASALRIVGRVRAYQAGETDILPAIDALRSERDASLAAVQDQLAFQEALAEWLALTGRDE